MIFSESGQILDIAVVGGGLLGAAIARDAALRGLSVMLFEQGDFGAGAVAHGSRLALGGLGALSTLDFTPVREDIREREILRQTLPEFVVPQTCLVPFYGTSSLLAQARLRAGLALTDALGFDHALRVHQLLSVRETKKRMPGLRPEGLLGAALVWEANIPEIERLARALAWDARRHGAVLRPQTGVTALHREPGRAGRERVGGVRWKDSLTGETGFTPASLTILAAGTGASALTGADARSWVKTISVLSAPLPGRGEKLGPGPKSGAGQKSGMGDALVLPLEETSMLLTAAPATHGCRAGSLSVSCTEGQDVPYAASAEVAALVQALNVFLPGFSLADVQAAQAAIHAPTAPGQEVTDWAVRDAFGPSGRLDGMVSASGAGVLRFRRVAEEAVDLACRKLGRALSVPPCRTASAPLPPLSRCPEDNLEAAAACAVAEEDCRTLRDFLERRGPQRWDPEERLSQMPRALEALTEQLGWDKARQAAEVKAWEAETALGQAFRVL